MMLPTNIRQKSGELFPNDLEKQKIFCMGAAFSLGNEALEMWLAYKKEKRQTYKPRGLEALKKKLLQLSSGNPEYAKVIVEYSMGNNYTGLFAPKNNGVNSYEQQQRTYNKINSILAG